MKRANLKFAASGQAAVIGMALAALLLAGCSKRDDPSKPEHRARTSTTSAKPQQAAQTNSPAEQRGLTDAEVGLTDASQPDSWTPEEALGQESPGELAATSKTNLTTQQIAELKSKAEEGDVEAQFRLSVAYCDGKGVPKDAAEGMKWMVHAAESGHDYAAHRLARAYRYGFGVATNMEAALRWLKTAAERGWVGAQISLAESLQHGSKPIWSLSFADGLESPRIESSDWGTGRDLAEAAKWYRKAADQGAISAQQNLGEMYLRGEGVPTNTKEGLGLLQGAIAKMEATAKEMLNPTNAAHLSAASRERSAKHNMMAAASLCSTLGDYYYQGQILPKDITNAIYWYEKAAAAPDDYQSSLSSRAEFQLGYIHATETKNFAAAAKWFRKRAEAGNPYAQCNLALLYYKGTGLDRDLKQAATRDQKVAEAGTADAQANLAQLRRRVLETIYRDGEGVPRDYGEAAKWFRASAEQGNADAQFNLAAMYRDGEGVLRDYGESVKWMRNAAEQGHSSAQNDLAVAYAAGDGVPRDYVEAYKWYNLAAAGAKDAEERETSRKNLNGITRYMTPDQIAEAQRRSSAFVARKEAAANTKKPNPFDIFDEPERPQATGTAFFITDDGYLLTSAHVVSPPEPKTADGFLDARPVTRIEVTVAGKTHTAKLVKADKANDVAVLKIIGESKRSFTFEEASQPDLPDFGPRADAVPNTSGTFKALPLAPSRTAKLGETICTLGFPNTDIQGTEPKFTTGEINSLAGIQDDPRHFQISVPVQPGSSGGPLLDSSGNVIGIVSARLADIATLKITGSLPQNVNYALKSSFITAFLETMSDVAPS